MISTKKNGKSKTNQILKGSFGFNPNETQHHFVLYIPTKSGKKPGKVTISEHFVWDESNEIKAPSLSMGNEDSKFRVIIDRSIWDEIANITQIEFNKRLKYSGLPTAKWKVGNNILGRLFGKELTILTWAIEDADMALIPVAIKNWLGLSPEERWWLFTMTNAATGHALTGRSKGWRKALRFALTENPVSDTPVIRPKLELPLFQNVEPESLWKK